MKTTNSIFRLFLAFCFAMRINIYLKPKPSLTAVLMATVLASLPVGLWAESGNEGQTDLAKKLANPIANLISIPIQANYDENIGPAEDGSQWWINIEPVIPLSIGENWNLITRTVLPLINQNDIDQWSVPINLTVAQLLKIGGLPVQVSAGVRYWADAPENGPEDWGARIQLTFLFPK